jgi:hypothetical protein
LGLRWDTSGDFCFFDPSSLIRQVETCDVLTKRKLLRSYLIRLDSFRQL